MKIISKKIEDITEKDLLEIEQNSIFEDLHVEFKYQYNKNPDELREILSNLQTAIRGELFYLGLEKILSN